MKANVQGPSPIPNNRPRIKAVGNPLYFVPLTEKPSYGSLITSKRYKPNMKNIPETR